MNDQRLGECDYRGKKYVDPREVIMRIRSEPNPCGMMWLYKCGDHWHFGEKKWEDWEDRKARVAPKP